MLLQALFSVRTGAGRGGARGVNPVRELQFGLLLGYLDYLGGHDPDTTQKNKNAKETH